MADAFAASESHKHVIHVFQTCAGGLDWVHAASGLPWWASIPLCTLAMRLLLLPISLRQAKIIRTNYIIYKEAVDVTDKQLGYPPTSSSSSSSSSSSGGSNSSGGGVGSSPAAASASEPQRQDTHQQASCSSSGTSHAASAAAPAARKLSAAETLHRSGAILRNFDMLRRKCDAPHPIWIVVNPLIQAPCFILMGFTLRNMGLAHWPGFATQGALWFPDLTQVPLVMETLEMPMGPAGFIFPLSILAMMLTSLRMGFGAIGARVQRDLTGDNMGRLLRVLPPLLYSLAVLNLYVKVQLPHAALLHWATSSGFTLGLQLGLKSSALRQALHLATPQQLMSMIRGQQPLQQAGASDLTGPVYTTSSLPADLVAKVQSSDSADVRVIMGAQLSARHRYGEAMYCLDQALLLNAHHTRAHYSRGQVFSLLGRWAEAEACFRAAAGHAGSDTERGQALYCVATALHTQGNLAGAIQIYREAALLWQGQTVILFSIANALLASGRREEAWDALQAAKQQDALTAGSPFKHALQQLETKLAAAGENTTGTGTQDERRSNR